MTTFERIEWKIDEILRLVRKGVKEMSALDDKITALQTEVTNMTTVDQSAITLINGIAAQIQAAVTAALAQGATAAQLQALTDLQTSLTNNDTALAAAVSANTPPAPPAPAPGP